MMMRSIVLLFALCLAPCSILAQNTLFVRTSGSDAADGSSEGRAKKTLQSAVKAAQAGDIIDVGPGTFDGTSIDRPVVIQGANASYALAQWDVPTVIGSTLSLTPAASGGAITLVGLQFGAITPLAGACANANITIYNCKFVASRPIATAGTEWAELFLTASLFEGKAEGPKATAVSTPAVSGGDVAVMVIRENMFRSYARSAIEIAGKGQVVRISYNEFASCNSSADVASAAVKIDATSIEQEVTVEKSLFTSCAGSVSVAGTLTGKTVAVQNNSFRATPKNVPAIRNTSATPLNASCNAFNVPTKDKDKPLAAEIIARSLRQLVMGSVTISPTNLDARDVDGDAIGYEPDKAAACASDVKE